MAVSRAMASRMPTTKDRQADHTQAERMTVLLVEDDPTLIRLYGAYLENMGVNLCYAGSIAEARAVITEAKPAAILLDLILPDGHGHELLREIRAENIEMAVIVVTSAGSINMAVESMRLGAFDFLVKPFSMDRLKVTLGNALEMQRLKKVNKQLRQETPDRFENFIGASPAMQAIYRMIKDAAPSKASVFITGESGTGKELAAEGIHHRSNRASGPFVALNCSAIPRDLVESELFGHVKGAFTGAMTNREGFATQADGGTLFLDELGEMDMSLQSKLLRFIQTGTFQPVGDSRTHQVDVRFVCATNRDPLAEVEAGRLREDLYYRLNVVPMTMPALRERGSDIILIARQFLQVFAEEENKSFEGFDPEVERTLLTYRWPGNVRQLQNVVRNIVVLSPGGVVMPDMLPAQLREIPDESPRRRVGDLAGEGEAPTRPAEVRPLWRVEREAIERALARCNNNIGRAAALLEIDASTIYRKKRDWAKLDAQEA
jgi:two-component system repressor protein LuxO